MANVLDRAKEALDLARRAQEALRGVTSTIADGREAINETRMDRLEAMLKAEKLETQQASDDLMAAIKEARTKAKA
jgi:hypothetical protein